MIQTLEQLRAWMKQDAEAELKMIMTLTEEYEITIDKHGRLCSCVEDLMSRVK